MTIDDNDLEDDRYNKEFHSKLSIQGVNPENYTRFLSWHKIGGDLGYWDFDIRDVHLADESMMVSNHLH